MTDDPTSPTARHGADGPAPTGPERSGPDRPGAARPGPSTGSDRPGSDRPGSERPGAAPTSAPAEAQAEEEAHERNPFRRVWWLPVVRGVVLVVLGLLLMIEPLEQLGTLRLVLGAFLVADGVLVAVQGFVHRRQVGSAWWLAQAGVNVVFGVVVALWPDLSPTALYYVLAVWVLVLGITTIAGAAALARNRDLGWAWMLAFGIVSVLFGILLVTRPLDSFDVLRLVAVVFAPTRSSQDRSTWCRGSRCARWRASSRTCARRPRRRAWW
ncbi:HdeD family acid-resistance protein [Cellulosimicrobium sp. CUA-896]|uniref:HdeD family acid-resistance protein n=1 Tax=Cellulosimicrobium sp. CUA-896 TaxID=1517881 RepID=UPI00095A47B7|nr:DUF308 domain-containing protein [Cellulosimicrobium sp. CUA-896]OLT54530.1 hypothetical protein BJF88_08315 [Cellulosimicrobium sp. CUA-896]